MLRQKPASYCSNSTWRSTARWIFRDVPGRQPTDCVALSKYRDLYPLWRDFSTAYANDTQVSASIATQEVITQLPATGLADDDLIEGQHRRATGSQSIFRHSHPSIFRDVYVSSWPLPAIHYSSPSLQFRFPTMDCSKRRAVELIRDGTSQP